MISRSIGLTLLLTTVCLVPVPSRGGEPSDPFLAFHLPDDWEARFWASPNARALFALEPRAVADLVPVQAGIRFCRCPACDSSEADDTLDWSVTRPRTVTCSRCGVSLPNDKFPAHPEKKPVPEETIEVLPRVFHHYPYHEVEPLKQQHGGERLYLEAKRDYEAREYLSKAALYAALRYRRQPPGSQDRALARVACVILVRFAQVYPAYAMHYDQPSSPKFFQRADLAPPYRRNYATAKWDWTGSLNVPLNLVVAYALLRGDPALAEAGALLGEPNPGRLIEVDLFQASAELVRRQPEEFSEASLEADRGILVVGRLLRDKALLQDALARLNRFAEHGFYHDGYWRQGTLASHRRIIAQLDGWIERLLQGVPGASEVPMLALAHSAGSAVLAEARPNDVQLAGWPGPGVLARAEERQPRLLGGAGLARLAIGSGDDALDLELRSLDSVGPSRIQRQALRLSVGGVSVLGDLDGLATRVPSGFDRATVSHNTVLVDGQNQRESLSQAREFAPGGDFLFFAADPDFQVVTLDDPRSYPTTATRYRQTIVASTAGRYRYALSVFEVRGGLQHDQVFHAPAGSPARWRLMPVNESTTTATPLPESMLSPAVTFVPVANPADDRWFIQSYGDLRPIGQARTDRPTQASCVGPTAGVTLHLLGDTPMTTFSALSPDPTIPNARGKADEAGRASLIVRREFPSASKSRSTFVTLFEPVSSAIPPLEQVARVTSPADTVVVRVSTQEGGEYLILNLTPGKAQSVKLAEGQTVRTDGLALRISKAGMTLAGGTFAEFEGRKLVQHQDAGKIVGAVREASSEGRGWFETPVSPPDPEQLAGRVMLVQHGDGTTHGWTVSRVETVPSGARIHVREEPGFIVDPKTLLARFYQFPQSVVPGPHEYRIGRMTRETAKTRIPAGSSARPAGF
jgi:hypothetical protein